MLARNAWSMRGWVVMWFDVSSREELDAEQLPNVAKIDQLSESAFADPCTVYEVPRAPRHPKGCRHTPPPAHVQNPSCRNPWRDLI